MSKRKPGRPYLVFAGTGNWLIESARTKEAALNDWFEKYDHAHGGRVTLRKNEIRVRRLRLDDESWIMASFGEGQQVRLRKKFEKAFAKLRGVDRRQSKAA